MADPQINRNSIHENVYDSKLILLQSFYSLEWSMFLRVGGVGGVWGKYLIIDAYNYFTILMRKWTYSFIYYLRACVISCFLMSFKIWKEHREYCIKRHIMSSENCVRCKPLPAYSLLLLYSFIFWRIDFAVFVNQPLFIWFQCFVVVQLLLV